jgi:hypothetical protein
LERSAPFAHLFIAHSNGPSGQRLPVLLGANLAGHQPAASFHKKGDSPDASILVKAECAKLELRCLKVSFSAERRNAMSSILTTALLGSVVIVGSVLGVTLAQDTPTMKPCVGELCPPKSQMNKDQKKMKGTNQNEEMQGQAPTEQTMPRKRKRMNAQQTDVDVDVSAGVQAGEGKWRFDSNRHQRRRSKNATFRFYLDGYWYAQPYWQIYAARPYRISCGEGRTIVAQRFNRVRVVECRGGTYTYLGRRQGETFRILLNSRTGRIVGRMMI